MVFKYLRGDNKEEYNMLFSGSKGRSREVVESLSLVIKNRLDKHLLRIA